MNKNFSKRMYVDLANIMKLDIHLKANFPQSTKIGTYEKNKWIHSIITLINFSISILQEISNDQVDTNSAYILFYEQQNVDFSKFMPDLEGKEPDLSEIEDEFESDFKKACVIQ